MSSNLQSYKIQKYLNKLQSVSQDHPSYQLYLSKYMYWLEGGVDVAKLKVGNNYSYTTNDGKLTRSYKYCKNLQGNYIFKENINGKMANCNDHTQKQQTFQVSTINKFI